MWPLTLLAVLAVAALADATVMGLDTLEEEKRAPLGFNGMRGKKDDLLDDGFDKRGGNSLGFSGMRGKKDDLLDDGFDKRGGNSLGFSGMRGKKSDEDADDAMDKRARNQLGFSGMRGKKDDYDLDVDDVFDKRTRNMLGFSGMRGKKASSDEYVMDDLVNKRARHQLGFSGMRGKKDGMDDVEAYLAKRARQAAFVGMRGRRENGQAFFGMRGKRNPGDGFGTFDTEDGGVLGFLRSPEAARDGVVTYRSKRYLPYNWQLRNSKKAPFSGFIGLRGKKSVSVPSFFRTDEQRDLAK